MSAPFVTKLDAGYVATVNYPKSALLQAGNRALLFFTGLPSPGKEEIRVVAVFEGCLASRFGYPNDEALDGHPLAKSGLGYYGVFEVMNSTWMDDVRKQNRVSFPDYRMPDCRHFIITLHDDTFECLAEDLSIVPAHQVPAEQLVSCLTKKKNEA